MERIQFKKTDLANLKTDVDKLDIEKFKNVPSGLSWLKGKVDKLDVVKSETTPVDLSELRNVVKNDVVKKNETKLLNLKRKLLIIIMLNIFLRKNLIN